MAEEWFFNRTTRTLYFYPNRTVTNGTTPMPPTEADSGKLAVVHLQNLLRIEGEGAGPSAVPGKSAGWRPARNITVRGLGFRDAGWTVLAPHGAPSGASPSLLPPPRLTPD